MENGFAQFLIGLFGSPIVNDAYSNLKEFLKSKRINYDLEGKEVERDFIIDADFDDFDERIKENIREVNKWSKDAKIENKTKSTSNIYVKLKFYLNQRKTHFEVKQPKKIEISEILKYKNNVAIYGGPGAGKSTSMKFLCQEIFSEKNISTVPIVIRFREIYPKWGEKWSDELSISKKILNIFGITLINQNTKDSSGINFQDYQRFSINLLNSLKCTLILDGFDEISSIEQKDFITDEIRKLTLNLEEAKFIVTSRTGDFNVLLENTFKYEIAPLSDKQIKEFIFKWLENERQSNDLFNQIKNSPFNDTAVRPLTLGQLCNIYDSSPTKKIPEKPKSVYRLVLQLLLKHWSESRSIKRISKYANFEIDRKEEFLFNLAYLLTVKYNTIKFNGEILKEVYHSLAPNFGLPANEVEIVLNELESHNGIFVQSGYDTYEFSHLSLQEFLTASYVVSIGTIPTQLNILNKIPNALAIATVISANQTEYFYNLVFSVLIKVNISSKFLNNYFERLILEKPDFSIAPLLAISLLTAIDKNIKIINKENKSDRDLNIKSFKELEEEFHQAFTYPVIKNSFKFIADYYRFKGNVFIVKYNIENYFFTIKRTKILKDDFNSYKTPNQLTLPLWSYKYLAAASSSYNSAELNNYFDNLE